MILSKKEKKFLEYFKNFYGKDGGLYKEFFDNSLTEYHIYRAWPLFKEVMDNLEIELEYDSIDRETFRDFLFLAKRDRYTDCFRESHKVIIENTWQCEELNFRQQIAIMAAKEFKEEINDDFFKNIKTLDFDFCP